MKRVNKLSTRSYQQAWILALVEEEYEEWEYSICRRVKWDLRVPAWLDRILPKPPFEIQIVWKVK